MIDLGLYMQSGVYSQTTILCLVFLLTRYDFNDSNVSSTTPERAVTGTAYVLFYKRRYVVVVCCAPMLFLLLIVTVFLCPMLGLAR